MSTKWRNEEGAIIVVAFFVVLALAVTGSLAIMLTNTELDISRNDRFGKEAFFVADAGCPITTKVLKDMILNEGIDESDYEDLTFNTNLLNEVRNYYEDEPDLNDEDTDTTDNNPDIKTTIVGKELTIDVDWRLRKSGAGGPLLFAMGYESIGTNRSHGGIKIYYDLDTKGKAAGNSTAEISAVYLNQ
jgi:hypothetical protein